MTSLRSFLKTLPFIGTLLAVSACDVSYPVTVIGDQGAVFRGTASNTFLEGGSFHATNGKAVCYGRYKAHAEIQTVSFPVDCNNGLTGIGTAFFETPTKGSGFVTMKDGSRWQFLFGKGALRL